MAERGNPQFKKQKEERLAKEAANSDLSMEERLALAEKKNKELEKKLAVKSNNDNNDDVLIIPDNARIEIKQNISGTLLLKENKGKINIYISLNKYGATARMSYEEINALYGTSPSLFTSGKVAITKIQCMDKRITLEEVIKDMLLEDIYLNKNKVSPLNIEDIFMDKVSDRDFETLVSNSKEIIETIIDVANILYRIGKFNNNSKMNYLRQILARPNLFR
jgi:hypothetical protein